MRATGHANKLTSAATTDRANDSIGVAITGRAQGALLQKPVSVCGKPVSVRGKPVLVRDKPVSARDRSDVISGRA
ncbi:hypothetical protein KR767_18140 [Luteibacter anthropi]|uniref:hypothetical protein n=1 Tax=Luteibacter anthropi TaxID=564369 RepID=UPI0020324769|nr:hypothetical protein [Luteibacter anthropi]URX61948.1 hypothetical protein KR767_18140 [Luteibacter anthropi]